MSTSLSAEELFEGRSMLTVEHALYAALKYVERGWAVTAGPGLHVNGVCSCRAGKRCVNPGKHPYKGWNNDSRKSLNEEQIRRWWGQWERGGAREGTPVDQVFLIPYLSGLVVADVDDMAEWEKLDSELRPDTLSTKSGSGRGGHHIYKYTWDVSEEVPPSLPGKLPGGAGELKFRGVIVAPPSVHPSGGRYEWVDWSVDPVEVPEELLKKRISGSFGSGGVAIPHKSEDNSWMDMLFRSEWANVVSVGSVTNGRPVAMFAAAASMGPWIDGGWVTEETVLEELLNASNRNGSLDKYGEQELTRQILNGIREGRSG